jgi:hypothetical protein
VIVQYDTNARTALWARAATGGGGASRFYGVVMDSGGVFTAAGYQTGTGTYTYGPGGISATGGNSGNNAVVVGWR